MEHLADVSVDTLQAALEEVEEKKPTERLIAAIAYKHGITQSELATWFDVERKTIYNWLTRLERRDLTTALRDEHRPGRPRKLTEEQLEELRSALRGSPTAVGVDAPAWTTGLVREFIAERFGVEYSRPSCRRIMKEAGLRHMTARTAAATVDRADAAEFERAVRGMGHVWLPE